MKHANRVLDWSLENVVHRSAGEARHDQLNSAILKDIEQPFKAFAQLLLQSRRPLDASAFNSLRARPNSSPRRSSTPVAALPSFPAMAAACIVPTCLGFWKNGYAVSLGYGGAMAAGAYLTLPGTTGLAAAHAAAFIFYGIRLNLFLLYRELALPESVHQMVNRPAGFVARLKRAPVILGCAFLYFCMLAPLRVTASTGAAMSGPAATAVWLMWVAFGIAALGDTVKSAVKAMGDGSDTLVTAFPFNFFRHPNYTGEFIGWTASFVAALFSAVTSGALKSSLGWLGASALGTIGIQFVLAGAAAGLEKKQKMKYGERPEYQAWVAKSWAGPVMGKNSTSE